MPPESNHDIDDGTHVEHPRPVVTSNGQGSTHRPHSAARVGPVAPGTRDGDPRRRGSGRTRRRLVGGAVLVAVGGGVAVWAVAGGRHNGRSVSMAPAAAPRSMAGMPGMEGPTGARGESGTGAMAGMPMDGSGSVRLTADQLRTFGVTFGTAEVRPLVAAVRTVGTVTEDETRLATVTPRVGGYVERLYVESTGQPVRRGQPLMDVYSPELVAAQEDLLVAQRLERTLGESAVPGVPAGPPELLAAARRRLQLLNISAGQIDDVLRTGRTRRALTLYAPATGIVLQKNVVQGQAIQPGQALYTIADLSTVWVDVELRESDAGAVRSGSTAALDFGAYPGRTFTGRVDYVYPTVQEQSRTLRARVVVPNPQGLLKPGMYATVRLTTSERSALTVPTSAVIRTGDQNLVFVDMGTPTGGAGASQQLMPHEVEVGRTAGNLTEVLAGLAPGQRVVTSAQFLLESESNLGEIMKSMIGMGGGGGMQDMPGMDMKGGTTQGGATSDMNTKGADMRGMPGMQAPAAAPSRGGRQP